VSARQIALFNLKSGRVVETAPIKTQCSRDYFYTKNPIFEKEFSKIEGAQKKLFTKILTTKILPEPETQDRRALSSCIMFQAGRTQTTAARVDFIANQFGKAFLRESLKKEGRSDLLVHLPKLQISMPNAVIDAIGQFLVMSPLIDDLDCTLFVNETKQDFLTSDHPVALCNNLPAISPHNENTGFSSRGLIILFPLSPRVLLLLTDREVYMVESNKSSIVVVTKKHDVVELNLLQCTNASENLYFSSSAKVSETLQTFRKRQHMLRKSPPVLQETSLVTDSGRKHVLLELPPIKRRLMLPKILKIRHVVKKGKYVVGDVKIRDPFRTAIVEEELDRLQKRREQASKILGKHFPD